MPWSKTHGKGQHLSPQTEFKPGHRGTRTLPVGSVTVRTHKDDSPRAWVKIAEPNVWKLRAVVVWEVTHGPLPEGHLVHHRDRDSMNDDPTNLQAMTRPQHLEEHRDEHLAIKQSRRVNRKAAAN